MQSVLMEIPLTPQQWAIWAFHHALSHKAIIDGVFARDQIHLQEYLLDPIPDVASFEIKAWLENHQQAHSAFNAVLGTAVLDLSTVDLTDESQRRAWIFLNWQSHVAADSTLGI
jgi:hypothetical protein